MKQALRVAFGFLILWASVLHAEVRIVIDSGVDSGRPIGVVPFQWAGPGAAPEDIGGIVAADLRNSGKFNPLDRARLPQQPGSAQEVQPAAWSALGIYFLCNNFYLCSYYSIFIFLLYIYIKFIT